MGRDLRSWSDDDENYIRRKRRCVTAADLAFHFGVTQKAMESKLRRMGVRKVSRVTDPEPGILWELSRAVLTDSETRGIRVASTAAELGLHWPVARRGETVGDYAGLKWEQLIDCPGLGRKKIDVLLSCFMTLAAARGVELLAAPLSGVPELSDAFLTWESCRNIVHEHDAGHHNISEWAEAIGERWPASRSGETFSPSQPRRRSSLNRPGAKMLLFTTVQMRAVSGIGTALTFDAPLWTGPRALTGEALGGSVARARWRTPPVTWARPATRPPRGGSVAAISSSA